jgi:hypothetical protein
MLRYLQEEKRNEKLCRLAVENNGRTLEFVPDRFKTKELMFIAVRQDKRSLKYTDVEKLTKSEYTELCRAAFESAAELNTKEEE